MLSRRFIRLAQTQRSPAQITAVRFYKAEQKGDTGHQANQAGFSATDPRKASPIDAASPDKGKKASHGHIGNQEGLGFAEQVGSQSATASSFSQKTAESAEGIAGEENVTPPSFFGAVKSKLGYDTTADEAKQNRGGGAGVTGTGKMAGQRNMHTSAVVRGDKTQGQAPQASREPKESTNADQNAHLKHKSPSAPDSGKGNAAPEPTLPSKQAKSSQKSTFQQQRGFSTSTRVAEEKHTADSYFKEVDTNQPTNSKVHQVDSSAEGASVARANEKTVTGEFSRSGPEDSEYETMSKSDQPYDVPPTRGPEKEQKSRYGGQSGVNREQPSQSDEGPAGKDADGRKPEGRS